MADVVDGMLGAALADCIDWKLVEREVGHCALHGVAGTPAREDATPAGTEAIGTDIGNGDGAMYGYVIM